MVANIPTPYRQAVGARERRKESCLFEEGGLSEVRDPWLSDSVLAASETAKSSQFEFHTHFPWPEFYAFLLPCAVNDLWEGES